MTRTGGEKIHKEKKDWSWLPLSLGCLSSWTDALVLPCHGSRWVIAVGRLQARARKRGRLWL
jgi:hypothetical protein